jgi:molybdopterin/thiamine biosynthesis adenylyltransferase
MYSRNRIDITHEEQKKIRNFHILFAGSELSGMIAECALRLGFERISIIDGYMMEDEYCLNNQYYGHNSGKSKTAMLKEQLLSLNPYAEIITHNQYFENDNLHSCLNDVDVAINTIDFNSDAPFEFERICTKHSITALHPYNLGWAACVFAINEESKKLSHISNCHTGFELKVADYIIKQLVLQGHNPQSLGKYIQEYIDEPAKQSPHQLDAASWIAAGLCTDILFSMAVGKEIKLFPDFYFKKL